MEVPPGAIIAFAGDTTATDRIDGWELCDGRSVSKEDERYARLFTYIGTLHGGDGNPNFNLPDFRGRFLRGADRGTDRDPNAQFRGESATGGANGSNIGSTQEDGVGPHGHPFSAPTFGAEGGTEFYGSGVMVHPPSQFNPTAVVFDQLVHPPGVRPETRPKNVYVDFLIKL